MRARGGAIALMAKTRKPFRPVLNNVFACDWIGYSLTYSFRQISVERARRNPSTFQATSPQLVSPTVGKCGVKPGVLVPVPVLESRARPST